MEPTPCIKCGTRHWPRMPCPAMKTSVANASDGVANTDVANRMNVANTHKRVANEYRDAKGVSRTALGMVGAATDEKSTKDCGKPLRDVVPDRPKALSESPAKSLKPRRGSREAYNARQREYMRKRRASA